MRVCRVHRAVFSDMETRDFAQVREIFEVEDNAAHEPVEGKDHKKEKSVTCSKKFWQSRFSGWPVAFIFGLYVWYLLVFVLLPTDLDVKIKRQVDASDINSTIVTQIKYVNLGL